jgi:hypothetical protein
MAEVKDKDLDDLIVLLEAKEDEIRALNERLVDLDRAKTKLERQRNVYRKFYERLVELQGQGPKPIPEIVLSAEEEAQFADQITAVQVNTDKWKDIYAGLRQTAFNGIKKVIAQYGL